MSDQPVTESTTEPVIEAVTTPDPPKEDLPDIDVRPPWVDEIVEAITAIPDKIAEAVPNPVAPDNDLPVVEAVIPDETPQSKPWTAVNPFKRD